MSALDKLKSLINLKGIDISKLENISLVKDAQDVALFKVNKRVNNVNVTINIGSKELKEKPELKQELQTTIREALNNDGIPILEENVEKEVQLIRDTAQTDDVSFFRGKITPIDMLALETAAYVANTYASDKKKADRLRGEFTERYGERGNHMLNLYSAGYFQSYFKPLYEALSERDDFSSEEFQHTFDFILRTEPFTVFVGRLKSVDETVSLVLEKVERCTRYGIQELNVHGIGQENIEKIRSILEDEEINKSFSQSPNISIKGDVAHATLFLK